MPPIRPRGRAYRGRATKGAGRLPGSFFVLLHRWDAQMGKHEFKGRRGHMGTLKTEGRYFRACFDNAGHRHR
jgi:hypothetical protein